MNTAVSDQQFIKTTDDTIQLAIADSYSEKSHLFRLMYDVYCKKLQWFNARDYPNEELIDRYDAFSTHIAIRKNGALVGGFRLVRDSLFQFPHESSFNLKLPHLCSCAPEKVRSALLKLERRDIVEVSRFVSTQSSRILTLEVLKYAYWHGSRTNVKAFFIALDTNLFLLCHKLGIEAHPIGIPKYIEGSWTIPTIVFYETMLGPLQKHNPKVYEYMCDPSNIYGMSLVT